MQNVAQIFEAFDGPAEFGRAIGVTTEHATTMRRRRSIPNAHWDAIVEAANRLEISGVDYESLARVHAAEAKIKKRSRQKPDVADASFQGVPA